MANSLILWDLCKTVIFSWCGVRLRILILEIHNVFLRLHEVKRQRYIFVFLAWQKNVSFFKGLIVMVVPYSSIIESQSCPQVEVFSLTIWHGCLRCWRNVTHMDTAEGVYEEPSLTVSCPGQKQSSRSLESGLSGAVHGAGIVKDVKAIAKNLRWRIL